MFFILEKSIESKTFTWYKKMCQRYTMHSQQIDKWRIFPKLFYYTLFNKHS